MEERREIAKASLKAGVTVGEIAEAYEVYPTQIRKWRRKYRNGKLGKPAEPALLALRVAEGAAPKKKSHTSKPPGNEGGAIHIEFARARARIEGRADAALVRAVLERLAG